jgi:taurine dioxygenase
MNGSLQVLPLTPEIGAEIHGIDLSKRLDPATLRFIREALLQHLVIFFRDQKLTLEQQKDFGRCFGELHVHPAASLKNHPEVFVVHADEHSTNIAGENWHSDVSCDQEPPMGSILHLHTVPDHGGDTLFANMYAAFDSLSDRMKSFLLGLTAVHESEHHYSRRHAQYRQNLKMRDKAYPAAEHPVVRTHPETGRKALFVNPTFTTRIKGLTNDEGATLLQFLFDHLQSPEYQCRFQWQQYSVAIWDNRCVQHYALWDYFPEVRHGYRVTIKGDRPYC